MAMCRLMETLFESVTKAYIKHDFSALAEAYEAEDQMDKITGEMAENHIKRLSDGTCTPDVGAQYLSLSSDAERSADHFINVAKTIRNFV